MGYERYPRNTAGGNDDRDQQQGYGRDTLFGREGYGARDDQSWNANGAQGSRDRNDYKDAGYGDRAPRYRDAGFSGQDRGQTYGARDYGRPDPYGNRDRGQQDYRQHADQARQQGRDRDDRGDDRGFLDRAGDEVRSWFGDDEANRRRDMDARRDQQRYDHPSDGHYHTWRRSQIEALDRDYDEYRRENRSKFDTEFGSWRTNRQTQRSSLSKVEEHMEVVGSDGAHVGKVDKVRGDRIILTKNDADAGGRHHSIPSSWIQSVDDTVKIAKSADDAKAHWRDEERNQALFGEDGTQGDRQGDGNDGPHVLGRSFSGTY